VFVVLRKFYDSLYIARFCSGYICFKFAIFDGKVTKKKIIPQNNSVKNIVSGSESQRLKLLSEMEVFGHFVEERGGFDF
jgi:hypothetical protein